MNFLPPLIGLAIVILAIILILKKVNPHAVLLFSGLLMLIIAWGLEMNLPLPKKSTGTQFLDFFRLIKESFAKTNAGVGLMIMAIGGFVSYIHHIGASSVLVQMAIKPLSIFKSTPHLLAVLVIPLGQILFICIPSAAGLGLLLMASVFPVLTQLGVSRISAASVITACTAFGIGPASAITARASEISNQVVISYFIEHQIPLVLPLSIFLAFSYYFVNKYFDAKNPEENIASPIEETNPVLLVPKIYAIIPVLPLFLLIIFSDLLQLFQSPILLDTTTAMLISLIVAMIFEWLRTKSISKVFDSLSIFWNGMGNIFKTVVTLIITAEIFSKGLISLGAIDALVYLSHNIGMEATGIAVIMTILIFIASMVMGSGNASFFAFAPLSSQIANSYDVSSATFVLPMNLSASMGRTVSPISGVLIAVSQLAGVSSMDLVKRNLIPFALNMILLLILHFVL
tara:strand:- start:5168 stop:6538 length:1371 start_codon:yes stop_codon:yes gene_type:complete